MRLGGKAGVITGGGSGIGRASAILFAREGANVIVADWNRERAEETVRMIRAGGGQAALAHTDISREDQVQAMIHACLEQFGRLDFVYNNAAIDGLHQGVENYVTEQTLENWNYMLSINLAGVFLGCKHAIPEMVKRGGGSVLSTASIAAVRGSSYPIHTYTAAKGAITALTRAMAAAYGPDQVRVNVILPGAVRTNMSDNYENPEVRQFMENLAPLRRIGDPEDIAYCALYLASDESRFVTGQTFIVDGGASIA
ncbi:MAG: SDR family NAD(P)-dependent oxidoreductase [Candidatus Binatia bacterium]